jgi:hypothetical protein
MKSKARNNVTEALRLDEARVDAFPSMMPLLMPEVDEKQPDMFRGVLKHYQLKGVTWLANLYDQVCGAIIRCALFSNIATLGHQWNSC